MDILNWLYLAKNKFVRTAPSSDKDLLVLGAKVGFNKRGDLYQNYAMSVNDLAKYVNESAAGNCPITMNFKPGSIGEKVSFVKVSGSDPDSNKDVIIPGLLEITRGNNGGIYNIAQESNFNSAVSPINTEWTTQYLDPTNTGWTPLWDLTSRTYDTWRNAIETPEGDPAPPMYVGLPAVMKYDDGNITKYYLIMFTEWGVGNENQYGFAYDRYEILDSVFFEQPSTDNTTTPQVIDIISDGVHITRSYEGGPLYNPLFEPYSNNGAYPTNTRWNSEFTDSRTGYSGFDDLSNLESRIYTSFVHALDGNVGNNLPGTDLIMHDITTDLYYKVEFDTWAQGCISGNGIDPGGVTSYDLLTPGSGYPNSGFGADPWLQLIAEGGSGSGFEIQLSSFEGVTNVITVNNDGQNYQVGDILTFPYPGVTNPYTIEVLEICSQGGFAYTRTVIPQSCGIKFADGTVMNTAVTAGAGAAGTEMNYVQGILSPEVESDFIRISDTIVTAPVNGVLDNWGSGATSGAYTVGTYTNIPVSGGSGNGAIVNVDIFGVNSYNIIIVSGGSGYLNTDSLAFSAGGTSFSLSSLNVVEIPGVTNSVYKLGGIANFQDLGGTASYSYLIGVIVGDSNLKLISDSTTISAPVNTFEKVSGKFAVNAYVRDDVGNTTPLTFATIVLDNTIASTDDYFVSIVATAGPDWTGTAYIDIEFMSDQALSYYN